MSENDFGQPYHFVFSLPHPTCNNGNHLPARGEQTDDVTYLRVESETQNDEEVKSFWQQWLSAPKLQTLYQFSIRFSERTAKRC